MKAKFLLHTTFLLVLVTGVYGCKKHGPAGPTLPPLTHEGKNTFGCLVNGAVYLPKAPLFGSPVSCYYQKLYPGSDGYVFVVSGERNPLNSCEVSIVTIYVDSISLQTGSKFELRARPPGKHRGAFRDANDCTNESRRYVTSDTQTGELNITYFNQTLGIVSGTFWFDGIDEFGNIVHITEGRFDMQYIN